QGNLTCISPCLNEHLPAFSRKIINRALNRLAIGFLFRGSHRDSFGDSALNSNRLAGGGDRRLLVLLPGGNDRAGQKDQEQDTCQPTDCPFHDSNSFFGFSCKRKIDRYQTDRLASSTI